MLQCQCNISITSKGTNRKVSFNFVHSIEIESSYENLTDTCKITLPRKLTFEGKKLFEGNDPIFKRGDNIEVQIGYVPNITTVFVGYIKNVGTNVPTVLECEDEMYLLKQWTINYPSKVVLIERSKKGKLLKHPKIIPFSVKLDELLDYCLTDHDIEYDIIGELLAIPNCITAKGITYFMWLSKTAESNNCTGIYEVDSFGALNQYIFEVVYGGLARGGRGIIRTLLSLVGVANKDLKDDQDSWNQMKDSFPRKAIAFILFPFIALNFLVPGMAFCSGIAAFLSGIFQEHIWWGLFFSFTIGIFISMATGFYMGIQTLYVFFLYPWVNNRTSSDKNKWSDIFNSLKTYMLFAFYLLICFYGYEDLGSAGGAGIMFIVVASIIMQWMKNSDDK